MHIVFSTMQRNTMHTKSRQLSACQLTIVGLWHRNCPCQWRYSWSFLWQLSTLLSRQVCSLNAVKIVSCNMKATIPQSNYLTAYEGTADEPVRGSQRGRIVETYPTGSPSTNRHHWSCQWAESTSLARPSWLPAEIKVLLACPLIPISSRFYHSSCKSRQQEEN